MIGTASARGLRTLGHHDLAGRGDGMQVMREREVLYVGHNGTSGAGTSILDVSAPDDPTLLAQWDAPANTHTHKVQVADGLLRRGLNPRTFPSGHPLDHCVRLTVRNREQDDRLLAAAREIGTGA